MAAVVELRRTGAGMVRHHSGFLQAAAILEIGRDVMPVARKLWFPAFVAIPAATMRRWIIAWAFAWARGEVVSWSVPCPMVRNNSPLGSSRRAMQSI